MEKTRLRASLRAARAAMDPVDRQDQSRGLARAVVDHLAPEVPHGSAAPQSSAVAQRLAVAQPFAVAHPPTVAAYLGVDPEPDTVPLLGELHRLGCDVVVPVCEPAYQLSWVRWLPGIALERSVRAPLLEPVGPRYAFAELERVLLILVPALGVDRAGNRVGQGGGYYDRFLAQYPVDAPGAVSRLGVVYRSEVLPNGVIPAEPYDQPLAGAFTADGLMRCGDAGGTGDTGDTRDTGDTGARASPRDAT